MFVGSSEISISIIVQYVQHTGITLELSRLFVCLGREGLIKFFSAWEERKNWWVEVC